MADRWIRSGLKPGLGAYVSWHLGPGEPYYRMPPGASGQWSPLILQLAGTTPADIVARVNRRARELGHRKPVLAEPVLRGPVPRGKPETSYAMFLGKDEFFKVLAHSGSGALRRMIQRTVLGRFLAKGTRAERSVRARPRVTEGRPEKGSVVVGVIDDGIAFAQARFRTATGRSRVEYAWVQDGLAPARGARVDYGREYSKREIDALLARATFDGAIDEDQFYSLAGMADFSRPGQGSVAYRAAHGTHVMDLACGEDPATVPDGGDKRPIVCVQLPALASADTSGASLEPYVLHAIDYILDRADRIAAARNCGRLPVVINFSYGFVAGPHNGTSAIEAAIDAIVEQRRALGQEVRIVLPAGNSNLTRCHAVVGFERPGARQRLHWQVLPDDRTSSFIEIWLPERTSRQRGSRVSITVTPPGGTASPLLDESSGAGVALRRGGDIVCQVSYSEEPAPAGRGRFFIAALPTAYPNPPTRLAPCGIWIIEIRNHTLGKGETLRAWIQRDDTLYGQGRRGRQSFFEERCYKRYNGQGWIIADDGLQPPCTVKRAGLINAIATGPEPLVAGGFRRKETTLADYSACGTDLPDRSLQPPYRNVDAAVVSDDSRVFRGVLGAGSRSGSVIAMNGTSVAAPQVARWVADELAAGRPGDRKALQALARREDAQLPPLPRKSRHRAGAGRADLPPVYPQVRYDN
jgi:hypothetical protein